MDFLSFLILLVISAVVAAVLHFGLKYYVVPGLGSYFGKVAVGWIGARLGSPVFGHWWAGVNRGDLYYVPAILGALALLGLAADVPKTFAGDGRSRGAWPPAGLEKRKLCAASAGLPGSW